MIFTGWHLVPHNVHVLYVICFHKWASSVDWKLHMMFEDLVLVS